MPSRSDPPALIPVRVVGWRKLPSDLGLPGYTTAAVIISTWCGQSLEDIVDMAGPDADLASFADGDINNNRVGNRKGGKKSRMKEGKSL
ncbi:hypothetical protein ElyMa_001161000 [Elysia marginata]|uniref:Uncharacterized protein n=1 Tax=Elysia marginata TaxID=1093978 RepID=A0AAV4I090_9GAST|nr:hypothetical protein ElyMa_001161000 [Elysia marginata]